jgi:hypothetical protein
MPAAIFLASSLVMRFRRNTSAWLGLEVDIRHGEIVGVADDEAGVVGFLDGPTRREAAADPEVARWNELSNELFEATQRVAVAGQVTRRLFRRTAGQKECHLGCVLVCRSGSCVYWFDIPKSYQAVKRLPFFCCTRIFGPFLYAPAAHDITQDCKFFVVDSDGLCHLLQPSRKG